MRRKKVRLWPILVWILDLVMCKDTVLHMLSGWEFRKIRFLAVAGQLTRDMEPVL